MAPVGMVRIYASNHQAFAADESGCSMSSRDTNHCSPRTQSPWRHTARAASTAAARRLGSVSAATPNPHALRGPDGTRFAMNAILKRTNEILGRSRCSSGQRFC